jgi:hypothetical protein
VIEVSITGKQWGQGHRQGRILHYHRAPLVGLTLSQPNPPPLESTSQVVRNDRPINTLVLKDP